MSTHPNRSKTTPKAAANPKPEAIAAARQAAGLTQRQAGELIYASERAWQDWEAGARHMHPAAFELFKIKLEARRIVAGNPSAARLEILAQLGLLAQE